MLGLGLSDEQKEGDGRGKKARRRVVAIAGHAFYSNAYSHQSELPSFSFPLPLPRITHSFPFPFPCPQSPNQIVGDAINDVSSTDFFKGKKVVLVGMPAAFSPTCSEKHVPGFLAHVDDFKKKGVDKIAVLAVNDFFTMKAWAKTQGVGDKLSFLADGNGEMTKALGVELDLKKVLLGVRSKRFSMVVEDGVVKAAAVEPDGTGYTTSSAENTLKQV